MLFLSGMIKMRRLYLPLLICSLVIKRGVSFTNCKPKIAVVGGGIGGASASHFLGQLFNDDLEIDLYETKALGGRLSTVEIDENEYESGGSIIHSQNKYMQNFVKLLGLEHRSDTNEKAGIWNGKQFVFQESDWKVISLAKLFYRYGIQPLNLQRYISSVLNDFEKVYDLQDSGKSFENVTALLSALNSDFPKLLQTPGRKHLLNLGYGEEFVDEVVESTMIVNYGQSTDIQSFVMCVSLAALTGDLWAVKGGNKQVPEHLIYRNSNVHVIPSTVSGITLLPEKDRDRYEVHYNNKDSTNLMKSTYDIVVLAIPLTADHEYPIAFEGFARDIAVPGKYHTTVATFVKAKLNPNYFGLNEDIDNILSCNTNDTIISSIGRLSSVEGHTDDINYNVWKIFSNAPLKQNLMDQMFSDLPEKEEIVWKAYPEYSTSNRLDKFKLVDGLYHVNAIEWAASAMEMSAIGGRNVAILAHKDFTRKCEKQDDLPPKNESTNKITRSTEL